VSIHDRLREWVRVDNEREASPLRSDCGQPECKTAAMVAEAVSCDAAKQIKGRKRHLTVDTTGLVLRVFVSAANVGERKGAKRVLKRVKRMAKPSHESTPSGSMGGYDGTPFLIWTFAAGLSSRITEQTKGFVLLKSVGSSERTFGWLMGSRRLVRDYELLPQTSETFIYLAMIRLMVKRLA